jgi:hypothetical protein
MGTAVRPAKTSPAPWDAFADVDAFVDEVLAELERRSDRPRSDTINLTASPDPTDPPSLPYSKRSAHD